MSENAIRWLGAFYGAMLETNDRLRWIEFLLVVLVARLFVKDAIELIRDWKPRA